MKHKSKLFFLIFLAALTIPSILGLIHAGFPLTDDGNWMVIRFSAFYEALRSGQFPVRFLMRLNNGYGYPVADFLYPLFMYIGVPIHILGFNFVNTIKTILILSVISSSFFSFLWLRKIFDNLSSLIGAVFYILFPYFLFDIYTRGSVGEVLALSVLPFVLWQIERKSLLLTSIGISALIVAHNTLAFLFIPFIVIYIFIRNKKITKLNLLTFLFGLGMSSFFWLPAIYDLHYTVFSKTEVSDVSSYFINNNLGLLGLVTAFLILESVFYLFKKKDKMFLILFLILTVLIFSTLSYSDILWKMLPIARLIQFPFRILSLMIPLGAFMVAYLLNKEKFTKRYILAVIYLVLIFISSVAFIFPKSTQYLPDTFYSTNQDTTTVKNEYMPVWVKNINQKNATEKVNSPSGNEKINIIIQNAEKISFEAFLNNDKAVIVNTVYFPGWTAYVNGVKTNINTNNDQGFMGINLKKGVNNVDVRFEETDFRVMSDIFSALSLLSVFVVYALIKRKKIKI